MKKRNGLIQFSDLAHFANECTGFDCVRVQCIRNNESNQYNGAVKLDCFGVAVRSLANNGDVYAIFLPAARVQIFRDMDEGKEQAGWDAAHKLETAVCAYLESFGVDIRPGVIYVDPKQMMYGGWSGRPRDEVHQ